MIKKIIFSLIFFILLVFCLLQLQFVQNQLADYTIRSQIFNTLIENPNMPTEDTLSALICGSRSPVVASTERAETCTMIIAGNDVFIIDVGDGSVNNLRNWGVPFDQIKAVFITHLHSDHISDLADLHLMTWVSKPPDKKSKLYVYGPLGIDAVTAGFELSHKLDYIYRNRHHGDEIMPLNNAGYVSKVFNEGNVLKFSDSELEVRPFTVMHSPVEPSFGLRFDYKGRSVVISGDTIPNDNVIKFASNADILIHEAQSNYLVDLARDELDRNDSFLSKIMSDIKTYHTTPKDAARVAKKAEVSHLILNHLSPAPDSYVAKKFFSRGLKDIFEDWTIAEDGMMISLPVGNKEINFSKFNR